MLKVEKRRKPIPCQKIWNGKQCGKDVWDPTMRVCDECYYVLWERWAPILLGEETFQFLKKRWEALRERRAAAAR